MSVLATELSVSVSDGSLRQELKPRRILYTRMDCTNDDLGFSRLLLVVA